MNDNKREPKLSRTERLLAMAQIGRIARGVPYAGYLPPRGCRKPPVVKIRASKLTIPNNA